MTSLTEAPMRPIILSLALAFAAFAAAAERAATVISVVPNVFVYLGAEQGKPMLLSDPLYAGERILSGLTGKAAFVMNDGSEVRLGAGVDMTLKETRKGSGGSSIFELDKGLFRAMVRPQGKDSFKAETMHGAVSAKEAQFQVEDNGSQAEIKVLKGSVEIKGAQADNALTLQEGEATISFKDRVNPSRKMGKEEIETLRKAFAEKVSQLKKDKGEGAKKAQGN
jgi:hypothetical protein